MVTMKEITDDEAALYDRQIRLWGVDAQRSLRSANVFVKGIGPLVSFFQTNLEFLTDIQRRDFLAWT